MCRRLGITAIAIAVVLGGMSALRAAVGSRIETPGAVTEDYPIACSVTYATADCVRCHGINPHRFEAGIPLALPPEPPNCARCHEQSLWSDLLDTSLGGMR